MTVKERKALKRVLSYRSSAHYGGWKMTTDNLLSAGKHIYVCKSSGSGKECVHRAIGLYGKPFSHKPSYN